MKRLIVLVLLSMAGVAIAAQREIGSADEISRALADAKPGDELVMKDGTWKDQVIRFKADGATDKPITLRAATPGKVVLQGKSSIELDGHDLVLDGVYLDHSTEI